MFGPDSLPVWSDALSSSSLSSLADWEDYGLHLQSNTGPGFCHLSISQDVLKYNVYMWLIIISLQRMEWCLHAVVV